MKKLIWHALLCSSLFFVHCGGDGASQGQDGAGGTNGNTGPAGPQGEPGAPGTPGVPGAPGAPGTGATPANVTLLTPSVGFTGRSLQVMLSTVSTLFVAGPPTVDFNDPDITITKTTVLSDDSLLLSLNIAPTAKLGAHTVTVTAAGQALKLTGGFTVVPALTAEPAMTAPTALQGGFIVHNMRNQDYIANPFASGGAQVVLSGAGLYRSPDYPGDYLMTNTSGMSRMFSIGLVNPLAATGAAVVSVQGYDAFGSPIGYYADPADPSLPQIKARNPTAITLGTAVTAQSLPLVGASNLYYFNNDAANNILLAQYSNLGTGFSSSSPLVGQLAPASGKFKDGQALPTAAYMKGAVFNMSSVAILGAAGNTYLASFLGSAFGAATYTYDATFRTLPSVTLSAKEPMTPDSPTMPLAIFNLTKTAAPLATDGDIDANNDIDYFQYTVSTPGDVFILVLPKTPSRFPLTSQMKAYSDSKCSVPVTTEISVTATGGLLFHDTATAGALTRCFSVHSFIGPNPYSITFVTQ